MSVITQRLSRRVVVIQMKQLGAEKKGGVGFDV